MRLDDLPESGNVEDRREEGGFGGGGGGFGLPIGGGGLSIGAIVALGLIGWALGIDPSLLIGGAEVLTGPSRPQVQAPPTARRTGAPQDDMGRFVSKVLGSTELQWKQIFAQDGKIYRAPVLVLYRGATHASCGGAAQSAMGPFYCPADQKVYLDTSFFDQIATRFRGCDVGSRTCQFSQAYVIAHEIGHHVQNQLGVMDDVRKRVAGGSERVRNEMSVRQELQADCLAGVWGNSAAKRHLIDASDVEAGIAAAMAVGDDRLQQQARGYVVPEQFTHGSSEQRAKWFKIGLSSGDIKQCNTFASRDTGASATR